MSEAAKKLASTRLAIVEHVHRRERRHDPREAGPRAHADTQPPDPRSPPPPRGAGWLGRLQYAVRMWWRYHPAQMAVEVASPVLGAYARAKPVQVLAICAAAGALLVFARPWRLISITTILVAIFKSSQLSHVLLSALSAADYEKDHEGPEG
jgi:hypothetical protein